MIAEMYKLMLKKISEYQPITSLGAKMDCGIFNRNRNTADWSARFPMSLLPFGDSQVDGAGLYAPLYYFGIMARMKLNEELDGGEWDFLKLNEEIKTLLHRRRWNEYFSTIWQKSMIFYSSMTVTNESRRFQVKLADDEVGLVAFFYTSKLTVAALASSATVAASTTDTGLGGFSTQGNTEELSATPSTSDTALATKTISYAGNLF